MICRNDQMILTVSDIKVLVGKNVVLPSKVHATDQHMYIHCKNTVQLELNFTDSSFYSSRLTGS